MALLEVLPYLVVLIPVLALAYYTTRMLGRGMRSKQRTGDMRVPNQMTVDRDGFLVVIKVQGKILLLDMSPPGIEKPGKLGSYEKMGPAKAPLDSVAVLLSQLKAHRHDEGNEMEKGGRGKE